MDSTVHELEPLCQPPGTSTCGAKLGALWPRLGAAASCVALAVILPGLASSWQFHHRQRFLRDTSDLGRAPFLCNETAEIPWSGKRTFNLTGTWKEKCASLPHPSTLRDVEASRNWCWEYMKHNGCYATHGFSSWYEDQAKLFGSGQAPPPFDPQLRLEGLQHPSICEVEEFGRAWKAVDDGRIAQLKSMVAVYVLSMGDERWRIISRRLADLGFPDVQRIPGVDLTSPGAWDTAVAEGLLPEGPPESRHQKGTLGCAAGHLRVLKIAEAEAAKPLALVLEDDVHPHEDFFSKVAAILQEVPCGWEVISLKSRCPYGSCVSQHLSRVMVDGNGGSCSGLNFGFFGMLYKVEALPQVRRALAAALGSCADVDVALASVSDRLAYYAIPAIQQPGLLHELHLGSIREAKNAAG